MIYIRIQYEPQIYRHTLTVLTLICSSYAAGQYLSLYQCLVCMHTEISVCIDYIEPLILSLKDLRFCF